jgi:hypothetical protein
VRKTDPTQQSGSASFDYYLNELDKKRAEANLSIQLDLLRTLAASGGEMRLWDLISSYLGGDVTGDDWLDMTEKIKKMQEASLISLVQKKGDEGGAKNLTIKITEIGNKALEARGFLSPLTE